MKYSLALLVNLVCVTFAWAQAPNLPGAPPSAAQQPLDSLGVCRLVSAQKENWVYDLGQQLDAARAEIRKLRADLAAKEQPTPNEQHEAPK